MDHLRALVVAALAACASPSWGGYAQLAPPAGWSQGGSGVATYRAAANEAWLQSTVRTNAALSVGGRSVLMPATMRLAANAPRFAARAIFGGPALAIALGSAALMAWVESGGLKWDEQARTWTKPDPDAEPSDGQQYKLFSYGWGSSHQRLCEQWGAEWNGRSGGSPVLVSAISDGGTCTLTQRLTKEYSGYPAGTEFTRKDYFEVRGSPCPIGWFSTPAGCVQNAPGKPVTPQEFEDILAPRPLPDTAPNILPIEWPVERPRINPTPAPDGPSVPLRVPVGEPVRVPNTEPQQWRQPVTDIVPAPLPEQPWRVDLQPKDIIKNSPDPLRQPIPVPKPDADPDTDPDKDPDKDPDAPDRQPDLCEKNPDILGCQKLDKPDDVDLQPTEKPISIVPDMGWGADNATCPQPRHLTVQGRDIPIPFDLFCTYMQGMRPVIIAMAWLSAAFILIGARGGD